MRRRTAAAAAARRVALAVESGLPLLTSQRDRALFPRQLAAASLARATAILSAIVAICDAGQARVAGILVRALFETYLVGRCCLLDGEAALSALAADRSYYEPKLRKAGGLGDDPQAVSFWLKASGKKNAQPLNYANMATAGDSLLRAAGKKADLVDGYNRLYRAESMFSAHACLTALLRYLGDDGQKGTVRRAVAAVPSARKVQTVAARMTAELARAVFDEFGIRGDQLKKAAKSLPRL